MTHWIDFAGWTVAATAVCTSFVLLWRERRMANQGRSAAAELAVAKERLELTQAGTGLTSWEWDVATDRMTWTAGRPNLLVLGGHVSLTFAEVIDGVHPDDREATREAAYGAAARSEDFQQEFRVLLPNGQVRWIFSRGKVFPASAGAAKRMLGINMDVTARKSAELELRAAEECFRAIFDQSVVGIVFVRPAGRFFRVNQKFCDMLGYSRTELEQLNPSDIVFPDDRQAAAESRRRLLRGEIGAYTSERRYMRKDGSPIPVEVSVSVAGPAGAADRFGVLIVKDITRRHLAGQAMKRVLNEVELARDAANAANVAKSRFLANMSHEIRTPLAVVLGFTELLDDPRTSPAERSRYRQAIARNGMALSRLINDILDLSKVEAGRVALEMAAVSLPDVLEEVRSTFAAEAAANGVALTVEKQEDVPVWIVTDPDRLRQILSNVIGNSIKFTAQGTVKVAIRMVATRTPETCELEFRVSDTGIGISDEQQLGLFDPFYQADASTTRKFGGTGLGLALSRHLARLLGGDLVLCASALGAGSTFAATLPVQLAKPNVARVAHVKDYINHRGTLAGMNVLLVDDMPDVRMYVMQVLVAAGATVDIAENGSEAVTMAMRSPYHVILMDMQMPVKDGYEATAELRRLGCKAWIIALTAHALPEERQRCFDMGCDEYLAKPVDAAKMVGLMAARSG